MTHLDEAAEALGKERRLTEAAPRIRVSDVSDYVVVNANYAGVLALAKELIGALSDWKPGDHLHLDYLHPNLEFPLVLMMEGEE